MERQGNAYRGGRVHVVAEMCTTCVFRPGNLMELQPGRLAGMVREATEEQSAIICHSTLGGAEAVCRGFFDRHPTQPLQVADRLNLVDYDPPQHL